ncbi:hypothetical protein FACS1894217_13690 [Clostridia bacterium]|nr:hypothetical protein FACS1894217_13690 [Clostridia bacterium]
MYVCKLKKGNYAIIPIERGMFENKTLKRDMFFREESGGNTPYAVCPECENPVQIVGLYTMERPYGKHFLHDVEGLATCDLVAFADCTLKKSRAQRTLNKKQRRGMTELSIAIYNRLRENFDLVVKMLFQDLEIHPSQKLVSDMLRKYKSERGWLYLGASLNNLPWIFGYMSDSQVLYGRAIKRGGDLHKALAQKVENIYFDDMPGMPDFVKIKSRSFCKLHFCLILHEQTVRDYKLCETVKLIISEGDFIGDNVPTRVFEKVITMDTASFSEAVCDLKREKIAKYIEWADRVLPPL